MVNDETALGGRCAVESRAPPRVVDHLVLVTLTDGTPTTLGCAQSFDLFGCDPVEPPEVVPTIDVHRSIDAGPPPSLVFTHPRPVALALLRGQVSVTCVLQGDHDHFAWLRDGLGGPTLPLALFAGFRVGSRLRGSTRAGVLPATCCSAFTLSKVASIACVQDGSRASVVLGHWARPTGRVRRSAGPCMGAGSPTVVPCPPALPVRPRCARKASSRLGRRSAWCS